MRRIVTLVAFALAIVWATMSGGARAQEASPAASPAASSPSTPDDDTAAIAQAKSLLQQAQSGQFDRSKFTPELDASLSDDAVKRISSQLKPLGQPATFDLESKTGIEDQTVYVYRVGFKTIAIEETVTIDRSGNIAGLTFKPAQ